MISQTLTRTAEPSQIAAPIILPLFMPSGKPYWYIPMERMALPGTQPSPPLFPSSIAQEAYYSSALDGAVEFSNHTRQALLFALQSPQVPMDAAFVETISGLLSGARAGFRATEIPGTPSPSAIPWHMDQLYRFIPDARYHPLVKSAVCHSFVLAVQPYNKCSGRLARLLTMMILIRSGYTFLLNSSYSAVIARRSSEYAHVFQSIFTSDNTCRQAGNQTGFVEFSIDILVEALDAARQQSVAAKPPIPNKSPMIVTTVKDKPDTTIQSGEDDNRRSCTDGRDCDDAFEDRLAKLDANKSPLVRRTATVVREMLHSNVFEFTRSDWYDRTGMTFKEFDACRDTLKRYHLICSVRRSTNSGKSQVVYRFTTGADDDKESSPDQVDTDERACAVDPPGISTEQVGNLPILTEMESSHSESVRNTAVIYRSFLEAGITEFSVNDWITRSGQTKVEFRKSYEMLMRRRLISIIEQGDRYRLTPKCVSLLPPSAFWARIEALEHSKSENVRKGAATVREMIGEGYAGFTSRQWEKKTGMLLIEFATIRNRLFENQLIVNENRGTDVREAFYRFTLDGINNVFDTQCSIAKNGNTDEQNDLEGANGANEKGISGVVTWNFIQQLNALSFNRSGLVKRGAEIIRTMISEGTMTFTRKEWMKWSNMTEREYATCYSAMSSRGMIRKLPKDKRVPMRYAFNWPKGAALPEPKPPKCIKNRCVRNVGYSTILSQLAPLVPIENFPNKTLTAMAGTTHHITESDWAICNHLSLEEAARDMNILCCMGIVTRRFYQKLNAFSYHILPPGQLEQMLKKGIIKPLSDYKDLPFWASFSLLEKMKSPLTKQAAATVRDMVQEGVFYFSPGSWVRRTGMNKNQFSACVKVMESQRVVVADGSLFRLTIAPQGTSIDYCALLGIEKTLSDAQINRIRKYASGADNMSDKRIGGFLLGLIENGSRYFTMKEYAQANQFSITTLNKDMLRARRIGLTRRIFEFGTVVYALSPGLDESLSSSPEEAARDITLNPFRKRRLAEICQIFSDRAFTRREFEEAFHTRDARHSLIPLVGLNLIVEEKQKRRYFYRIAVTPEERPECFEACAANPSLEQDAHQVRLAKRREAYAAQPSEKLEARRAQMRARAHARLAAETPEEREKRLSKEHERRRIKKATETPEEHENKLAKQRTAYAAQSPERLEARHSQMRAWVRNRNASETPEEREERLALQREHQRIKRAAETPEEHERKLAAKREYQRLRRAAETPEEHEKNLAARRENYRRKKAVKNVEV